MSKLKGDSLEKYKVGDEIEIKLRVKVVNDEPKSSFGYT